MGSDKRTIKTKPTLAMPPALEKEIVRMRRAPGEFAVLLVGGCRFCNNRANAVFLSHPLCENVACWCPVHGFIWFESNRVRPVGEQQPKPRRKAA